MDRRSDLDGLRGIAILATVVLHYVARSDYFDTLGPAPLADLLDSLWSGVDIFFVLSGFLIGGIVLDNGAAPNFFRVFYARRALRILPVAFVAIGFCFWILPALFPIYEGQGDVPAYAYALFINNLWTSDGAAPYPPLGPMWTLALEQQFYLVAPWLILWTPARLRIPVLIAIIVLSPIVRSFDHLPRSYWDFPLFRLDGLCAGVLVAALVRNQKFSALARRQPRHLTVIAAGLGGIMLLFSMFPPPSNHVRVAWGISISTLTTAAVILFLHFHRGSMLSRILSIRPLVAAGELSYFTYLMHMPVLFVVSGLHGFEREHWYLPVAFAVTTMLAWISGRCMEAPLIRVGKQFGYGSRQTTRVIPPLESSRA